MRLKLTLSAAAWGLYLPFVLALTVASYALAYVIALPFFVRHDATARESLPAAGRERLVWWLYWFQTFDNPLDEGFYGNYGLHQWVNRYRANYETSGLSKYMFRVYWLQRNAIYGFARWPFGATAHDFTRQDFKNGYLLVGVGSGWLSGFGLHWRYSAKRRLWLGWKIERSERDGKPRKMYTFQPFKKV